MNRREFGLKSALAIGGIATLAGCSEVADDVTGGLEIADTQSGTTAFNNIRVVVLVQNTASGSRSGTLIGQVDIEGGDTFTERRSITVPGEGSNSYELGFDIDLSDQISGGQYRYDVWME